MGLPVELVQGIEQNYQALQDRALRLTGNRVTAEDLVHDAVYRAARFADRFRPRSNYLALLTKIMMNVHLSDQRRFSGQRTVQMFSSIGDRDETDYSISSEAEAAAATPSAESGALRLIDNERFDSAFKRTPEKLGQAVALDLAGFSGEEAAEMVGIPHTTYRTRLFRGRRILASNLGHDVDLSKAM